MMRSDWMLGFLGFLGFLGVMGLKGLATGDWLQAIWIAWFFNFAWFIHFKPEKK
jgi:hypothetical protein